jgi:long-chain acyl-CoA synthetase
MQSPISPLLQSLWARGSREPDHSALVCGEQIVTWSALAARIRGGATILRQAGIARGDRVVIKGKNSVDWVACYFAIHAAGAIAVPVDAEASTAALGTVRARAHAKLVLADAEDAAAQAQEIPVLRLDLVGSRAAHDVPPALPGRDDVADILFTTGTTSAPKGVVLTHGNIAHAARNTSSFLGQTAEDVEVVPLPLSHSFGLGRVRCAALVGTCLVLEPGMKNPAAILQSLERHRATGFAMVPAGFALLRRLAADRFIKAAARLHYVEIGSAALSAEVRDWLLASLPAARLCHHYGLTEASRAAFVELHSDAARAGSIGKAAPNVEITIRDERGALLPRGLEGELWVEGGMVASGYLDDPVLSKANIVDGSIRTGDLGWAGPDGRIFLKGRRSDIINVGGLKVAPAEVEALLDQYEGITESACVGVADEIAGERVLAFYVSEVPIEPQLLSRWLRNSGLEPHKIPARFHRISALPRTGSGKLLRRSLRADAVP